jgi:acetyl-CoA C-acetyltransferase
MHEVVIVSLARTPIGSFGGKLASLTAIELGKTAMQAAMQRAGIDYNAVNEIYMGNVLQANVGQAPARQAALAAGFNPSVVCTTINKVCASGMKSVMLAAQSIRLGDAEVVLAGGMESMSQAPFLLTRQRWGNKYGNIETVDCIVRDALQDPYNGNMILMVLAVKTKTIFLSNRINVPKPPTKTDGLTTKFALLPYQTQKASLP